MNSLFPDFTPTPLTRTLAWQQSVENLYVQAFRVEGERYAFPVFVFENSSLGDDTSVLFLPQTGTYQELEKIVELSQSYHTVISLDYLGIGELKSNRILLHTYARYFMHNDPSAPKLNVEMIASYLDTFHDQPIEIYGNGWVPSLYALMAKWLEPQHVATVNPNGIPVSELTYLKTGNKIPDLLLWGNLFASTSARELAATLSNFAKLTINQDAIDSTSTETVVAVHVITASVTLEFVQLSNDGAQWQTFNAEDVQQGVPWRLDPGSQEPIVYARLVNILGDISTVISDTIHLIDIGNQATGLAINDDALFTNAKTVTLTINAPPQTAQMAIRDSVSVSASELADQQIWQWEPYSRQRKWTFANYGIELPTRVAYVQFRDVFGNISQSYFDEIVLDETPPTATIAIQAGAKYVNQAEVTLQLDAYDQRSGVAEVQIAEIPELSSIPWRPYSSTLTTTLSLGDGEKSIYVRYRDRAGNPSSIISNTILMDTVSPVGSVAVIGTISANSYVTVTLHLDASDELSGVSDMQVTLDSDFRNVAWQPYAETLTYALIDNNLPVTILARYRDLAGNMSDTLTTTVSQDIRSMDKIYLPLVGR